MIGARSAAAAGLMLSFAVTIACRSHPTFDARSDGQTDAVAAEADGEPRGCRDGVACAPGEYCEYSPGLCGRGKRPGTCRAKPAACRLEDAPVCGCDGNLYDNECAAHAAGVDLSAMGGCDAERRDWAPCGPRYCDVRTSYCEIYLSDVFDLPSDHFCRPLPESCLVADGAARTCDCFPPGTPCRSFCGPLATGGLDGFHLTCQGRPAPRR